MTATSPLGRWRGFDSITDVLAAWGSPAVYRGAGGLLAVSFLSSALDVESAGAAVALHPPLPGFLATDARVTPIWTTAAGAYVTPAQLKIGNNPAHDNQMLPTEAPALGSFVAGVRTKSNTIRLNRTGLQLIDLSTPLVAQVATAGSGGTLLIKLQTVLALVRAGDL